MKTKTLLIIVLNLIKFSIVKLKSCKSWMLAGSFSLVFCVIYLTALSSARENILVVGSGTVYPFASLIAEHYAEDTGKPAPTVERTGTGGGFAIFCQGVGYQYPDINDASRAISNAELQNCQQNGISKPLVIKIGFDGIALVYPKTLSKQLSFTTRQLFLALAYKVPNPKNPKEWIKNPYHKWNDISKSLPNLPIKVMGPPATSGTRDSFVELILEDACPSKGLTADEIKEYCSGRLRYDGAWVDGSENYNLILQQVSKSSNTIAIMGFNYYNTNKNLVNAVAINNVVLTKKNIMDEKYPLSRLLYIYVKNEHIKPVADLRDYIKYIISEQTLGENGYLVAAGLIPLPHKIFTQQLTEITSGLN